MFFEKKVILRPYSLFQCDSADSITKLSNFGGKINYSTHSTSKLIFLGEKRFRLHSKVIIMLSYTE